MGYTLLPTQTRIPIPRPPLPVDRFPSFIVITSPSVIVTTLSLGCPSGARAELLKSEIREHSFGASLYIGTSFYIGYGVPPSEFATAAQQTGPLNLTVLNWCR